MPHRIKLIFFSPHRIFLEIKLENLCRIFSTSDRVEFLCRIGSSWRIYAATSVLKFELESS